MEIPTDEQPPATGRLGRLQNRVLRRLETLRGQITILDTAMRVLERDRHAAGTLMGSALTLRLFLFFVPMVLLGLGIVGLLGRHTGVDSVSSAVDLKGQLALEIDSAFEQDASGTGFSLFFGIVGMAWTGRSLARALVLSSALSWRLGGGQKTPPRIVGIVVGITVGMALVWAIEQRIRSSLGVAVASVSFLAVAIVYVVLWSLLLMALPRNTHDPGAALPGAVVIASALTLLQLVSQIYLPSRIEDASSVYSVVGASIAVLGWFFIIGRTLAFSFALNAVIHEQHGSISRVVFRLPVLRGVSRRYPALARPFDLDDPARDGRR